MTSGVDSAIDELHRSGRLAGVALYAFGHTAASEEIRRRLSRHGLTLTGILDNNRAKQGGSLHGVPVIAPLTVADLTVASAVLIASRFHREMRQQLLDLGYAGEIIRVGSLSIATDSASGGDIDRGSRLLESLHDAHPGRHLVLCPFGALGDVYWALAYLPAYAVAHQLPEATPVVVGEGCAQVARLFGYADVHTVTPAEVDDLVAAVVASRAPGTTIAHHDRPYGDAAPVRVLEHRFAAFSDLYRDLVYRLPTECRPSVPRRDVRGPARQAHARWSVALPRDGSVLLAPYAKSVVPVPWSFWEQSAERYRSEGQAVATLVHGDERPLPGTLALEIPIEELIDAVEHAGTFIGLRSGLCDVVHSARAHKVHVFPEAYYSTTSHTVAEFFALPGWQSVVLPIS